MPCINKIWLLASYAVFDKKTTRNRSFMNTTLCWFWTSFCRFQRFSCRLCWYRCYKKLHEL